jgi:hypothetical protein
MAELRQKNKPALPIKQSLNYPEQTQSEITANGRKIMLSNELAIIALSIRTRLFTSATIPSGRYWWIEYSDHQAFHC